MLGKKAIVILCATINIVAGAAAAFAGGVLMAMAVGFGGRVWDVLPVVPLLLGGALYAGAGVCFLLPNQRAWSKGLAVQGIAILMGLTWLAYCMIAMRNSLTQINPRDEEVLMFVLLPAAGVLIASVELAILRRLRPQV